MQQTQNDDLQALFAYVTAIFETANIPYMVVGGFAATVHGEPRFTIDVDIVADMQRHHIQPFIDAFPVSDYYVSEEAIRDALARRYPFNVIHSSTGAKIDIVPLPKDIFTRLAFQRRQRLAYDEVGHTADFITAEDIILAKLMAQRETGSEKHLRDARGVLVTQWDQLNISAIQRGAKGAGVLPVLERLLESVRQDLEES